jgi:hypothetical protein
VGMTTIINPAINAKKKPKKVNIAMNFSNLSNVTRIKLKINIRD